MVTYIVLWKFTDEGARNIKHTTGRTEFFKAQAEEMGVHVKDYYWTLGGYDGVVILAKFDTQHEARVAITVLRQLDPRSGGRRSGGEAHSAGLLAGQRARRDPARLHSRSGRSHIVVMMIECERE